MPRLSVWLIRTSLIHLGLGLTLGAFMLANKGIPFYPTLWSLLPLHIEVMLLGWVVQLAMGVAYWILPRWGRDRGNTKLVAAAYILLNLGVLLTGTAHLHNLQLAGRFAEALAVGAFIRHVWPRIKGIRSRSLSLGQ